MSVLTLDEPADGLSAKHDASKTKNNNTKLMGKKGWTLAGLISEIFFYRLPTSDVDLLPMENFDHSLLY